MTTVRIDVEISDRSEGVDQVILFGKTVGKTPNDAFEIPLVGNHGFFHVEDPGKYRINWAIYGNPGDSAKLLLSKDGVPINTKPKNPKLQIYKGNMDFDVAGFSLP